MKQRKTFYVTTPIYYPSGNLHIGHVYTTTLAWVLRNYKKLQGYETFFLTGADEHGQKIELKAKEYNIEPQAYVEKMHLRFKKLWIDLKIDYDYFSRTSSLLHRQMIQKQFSNFLNQKYIYKGHYQGLYSIQDEEFVALNNAIKKGNHYYHPESNHLLENRDEPTYFLKITAFQKWLEKYYHEHNDFIKPAKIKHELINNFIAKGLTDLSISRDNFKWGIPVKEDPNHIIYVWFDALHNYISALGYLTNKDQKFQKFWTNGDEIVHLVGREISRFHCIYWPIMLEAAKLRKPSTIIAHGWIITPEGKMSKSKGNVIDPQELIEKYGAERVKYYFASQIQIGQDGIFDFNVFKNVINADLTNNFGNLVSRTIAMIKQNNFTNLVFEKTTLKIDQDLIEQIIEAKKQFVNYLDKYEINLGLNVAIELCRKLNGYIDLTKPWTLKEDKKRLKQVLNLLLNGIYASATILSIVIPEGCEKVRKQLNIEKLDIKEIVNFHKFDNLEVQKGPIIFERIK